MKQIEFKDLQKGVEILVDGDLYGKAVYEVFEKEAGFCVIAKDGELMALPEMLIESGAVKVYAVEDKNTEQQLSFVEQLNNLEAKLKGVFNIPNTLVETADKDCDSEEAKFLKKFIEDLTVLAENGTSEDCVYACEGCTENPSEEGLKVALRSMGLPPSFAVPYNVEEDVCDCCGCTNGVDEDEEIDITLTRKQIEKVSAILAFVDDQDIFDVRKELDPYIDYEVLDEDMESVVLTVDCDLQMFDDNIHMMENMFGMKFED